MPLLCPKNWGHGWSFEVACNCHRSVENPKFVCKAPKFALDAFAKSATSSICLVFTSYLCYLRTICFFQVSSPTVMWTLNMRTIDQLFTIVMHTTQSAHLQNSCAILKTHRYTLPVFFYGCGTTPHMK